MTTRRLAGAFALALGAGALAGCGSTISDPFGSAPPAITLTGNPFNDFAPITSRIAAFTAADVQAALDDANAQGDVVGALCWSTVQKALPALQPPKGAGGATAIQLWRDVQRKTPAIADACGNILPIGLANLGSLVAP